jgi:hypothetical protein
MAHASLEILGGSNFESRKRRVTRPIDRHPEVRIRHLGQILTLLLAASGPSCDAAGLEGSGFTGTGIESPCTPGQGTAAPAQWVAFQDDGSVPRYPPIMRVPVPFGRTDNVRNPEALTLTTDEGTPLPTQSETLSRWGSHPLDCGKPIRWAYLFALGNSPTGKRVPYRVVSSASSRSGLPPRISIEETKDALIVDTHAARFTLGKSPVDGIRQIALRNGDAFEPLLRDNSSSSGNAIWLDRTMFSASRGRSLSFEVERNGPWVTTIKMQGTYPSKAAASEEFRFTTRFHFYAGTATVQVDHTYYYGALRNYTSEGGNLSRIVDRSALSLALNFPTRSVVTRGSQTTHKLAPGESIALAQEKRSPTTPDPRFTLRRGDKILETGAFVSKPFLAVQGEKHYAIATIAFMDVRDPQGLRFNPQSNALELDWQSEPMQIGAARGIWSIAALDFGRVSEVDLELRGQQLYQHVSLPLIGTPRPSTLTQTKAYGALPERLEGRFSGFDELMDQFHAKTGTYLKEMRITGSQIWPDLGRRDCSLDGACAQFREGYFEGGDANYWDWSLVELEGFVRSSDLTLLNQFALPEAITMAETISFRPNDWGQATRSSFAGFSPCYGSGRGYDGEPWTEGLNHRKGNCPGDYSYNKVHKLAYILTADRRFLDLFETAAETVVGLYGETPRAKPEPWIELSPSRSTSQHLEMLLNAAEFSRKPSISQKFRQANLRYFDFMLAGPIQGGNFCNLLGHGVARPGDEGRCDSIQGFMLPTFVEWASRLGLLYEHKPALDWLGDYAKTATARLTAYDSPGKANYALRRSQSTQDALNGWRTEYSCRATQSGIDSASCRKRTDGENENYYYTNGLLAFLGSLGLVLEALPDDPGGLCSWLPDAYERSLEAMEQIDNNNEIWGKSPAQAYAFSQRTLGALSVCTQTK